jgi:drug/metabolite transporter (DMT)-like permease
MTRRGWLLFAAMSVIWGVPYLMIRVAVRELSPATLVGARTALAALILLPLAARQRQLRQLPRVWAPLLAFTAIEIVVPWYLLAKAETRLTSSLTGLLIAGVPLVGALVTTFTGARERHGARRWAGLLIGLAGVAALVGLDVHGAEALSVVEVAGVAVCYAVGPIILSRWLADEPPLGVVAASLALAALFYLPLAVASLPSSVPSTDVTLSVVGLAALCTAVAFLLFFALIAETGPVRATVITYVNPAVAALVGVTVLGERFTVGMAIGFALVLAGSILATVSTRERAAAAEPRRPAAREGAPAEPGTAVGGRLR